jgi:hypothetical protein
MKPQQITTESLLAEYSRMIKEREMPEGWLSVDQMAVSCGVSRKTLNTQVIRFAAAHPAASRKVYHRGRMLRAFDVAKFVAWRKTDMQRQEK